MTRDTSALEQRLDGNAAAGLLSEIFACELTAARATCVDCGSTDSIGALHMYAHEMGAVLRCPDCECVVLRVARTTTHFWLDASGARSIAIQLSTADTSLAEPGPKPTTDPSLRSG